ncbi:hypothetical protein [Corynebacterium sp. HMSC068G04]|uniref:hypothetical protein n=1 Tax=Corynebacterium sp. HMSC068G04 TaxID=1739497 RepID=UPI0008A3D580|nr:hypothetical protein [Corynebacterium sp. HMSC068G04]OFP32664.1 hypothetical protein HMPREF2993_04860 [Corynebacterium sp. HMSC068G04]
MSDSAPTNTPAERKLPEQTPRTVAQARARNEIALRDIVTVAVPAGIASGLRVVDFPYPYAVPVYAVLIMVMLYGAFRIIRSKPKLVEAAQEEYRAGDYPTLAYLLPVLAIFSPLITEGIQSIGLFGDVSFNPILVAAGHTAFAIPAFIIGGRAFGTTAFRVGKRRIQAITEKDSLEGVTEQSITAVEKHPEVLSGLVAAGAVTGNMISIPALGRLLDYEEGLEDELRELEKAGVVKMSGFIYGKGKRTYNITLTEDGVRSMNAAHTR